MAEVNKEGRANFPSGTKCGSGDKNISATEIRQFRLAKMGRKEERFFHQKEKQILLICRM